MVKKSNINFNDITNPVGSVPYNVQVNAAGLKRDYNLSPNNPTAPLIQDFIDSGKGVSGQDFEDLLDKANQWEVDYANWIMQLEVDQAIKNEQREYDSPLQQIARERVAGINRDIANSSGGAGSSSSAGSVAGATKPDGTSQQSNNDVIARQQVVWNGVLNTLNTVANFGQAFVQCWDTMSTLPQRQQLMLSQSNLMNSQAGLYDAQGNLVTEQAEAQQFLNSLNNQLVDVYKQQAMAELANTQNSGNVISADFISRNISNLGYIAEQLPESPTDDDISTFLTSVGTPADKVQPMTNAVRAYLNSPKMQATYAKHVDEMRQGKAKNASFTQEVYNQAMEYEAQALLLQSDIERTQLNLQKDLVDFLNAQGWARIRGANMLGTESNTALGLNLEKSQLEFKQQQLTYEVTAFTNNIKDINKAITDSEMVEYRIRERATKEGRDLSNHELLLIQNEAVRRARLQALGTEKLSEVYTFWTNTVATWYQSSTGINNDGELRSDFNSANATKFMDYTLSELRKDPQKLDNMASMLLQLVFNYKK